MLYFNTNLVATLRHKNHREQPVHRPDKPVPQPVEGLLPSGSRDIQGMERSRTGRSRLVVEPFLHRLVQRQLFLTAYCITKESN